MTKSEEREMQILISRLDSEKRMRLAAEKLSQEKDARISSLESKMDDLQTQLSLKIDENSEALRQLTSFVLGKGPVSISDTLRDAIVSSLREEFEKQKSELISAYEKTLAEKDAQLNAYREENDRLRNRRDDNDGESGTTAHTMSEVEIASLVQQNNNLKTAVFGPHAESVKHNHDVSSQWADADTLDINGEEIPAETVVSIAEDIKKERISRAGIPIPRRYQPLKEIGELDDNRVVVRPECVPDGSKALSSDLRYRVVYVKGYTRIICIELQRYLSPDGVIYEAKLPKKYRNCMGRTPATESIIAQILIMHYDQGMTIGDILLWSREQGLNFGKSTLEKWIALGADILAPMDEPLHETMTAEEVLHGDETTCKMCDKRLPDLQSGETDDDVEDVYKYFKRWLFSIYAPGLKLTQFFFHDRGRRSRDAIVEYLKKVRHRLYLHTDGAPLYKCFERDSDTDIGDDLYELITRIACLVHIRRPLYKLKDTYEEAARLVNLINLIFHEDKIIKAKYSAPADIKRERNKVLYPLFMNLKNELELLLPRLEQDSEVPELLKAVRYALKEFPCLLNCLKDGRLSLDNNACERTIRAIAKYRNNSFFVGSPEGGIRMARMKSIFANCRAHGVNSYDYLCDVFRRIGTTSKEGMFDLLVHRWQPQTVWSY